MSKIKYKSKFNEEWKERPEFKGWLRSVQNDVSSAFCRYCYKQFSIAGQGIRQVISHMNSEKHKQKSPPSADDMSNKQHTIVFEQVDITGETSRCTNSAQPEASKQIKIDTMLQKERVLKAEIIWALDVLINRYSYRSCEGKGELFSSMFPDSEVAKQFQMGKTKTNYVVCYGLAPFFKENLLSELRKASFLVPSFDESFNKVIKKGQMDLLVRFWNSKENKVDTRYLNSVFMGKAAATDVLEKFEVASEDLMKDKFVQVSSDGPNVNLKFLDLLDEKRKDDGLNELISIGTCGLHTVNRAFQNAENATNWDIKKILCAMHKIFDESPSRRADYERITSASKDEYPLFFCSTRWVENASVAKRAQKVWPNVVAIVEFWSSLAKYKQPGKGDPKQNKSYHMLLKNIKNPLVPLFFRFFEEIASKLNGFLRRFQTDKPMVPFLVQSLDTMIREMCGRFILDDVINKASSTLALIKLDVTNKNIQKVKPDIGFGLRQDLQDLVSSKKITDAQAHNFMQEVKKFLGTLCDHLITKTAVQSKFARCAISLNPVYMADFPEHSKKLFDKILEILVSCKHFTSSKADAAKREYANFLQSVVKKNLVSYQDYQIDEASLDEFFMRYFDGTSRFSTLQEIIKFVLILSHGQSAVERGFSINKNILVENLEEKGLISQRIVLDHMRANKCKPNTVPLTNDLLVSVKNSRRKYIADLAERKKQELKSKSDGKLEKINNEIFGLNQKKALLENTIEELNKDSVELAFEAEKQSKLELLSKSNALKRAATEKQSELEECLEEKKRLLEKKKRL